MWWAQQVLPKAFSCHGTTINDLAKQCFQHLYPILFMLATNAQLNNIDFRFISTTYSSDGKLLGRCKLVEASLLETLKETRKRLYQSMIKHSDVATLSSSISSAPYVVQLYLVDHNHIYISVFKTSLSEHFGWRQPLPVSGGIIPIEMDKEPPSRAYIKLNELMGLLGRRPAPGSKIAELGSAPGGWTASLLKLYKPQDNIQIQSVDRSPLESWLTKAYRPPTLTHHIANGLTWEPEEPVDWLFNDMALPPMKSVKVLERWIKERQCSQFAWTLKFVGESEYDAVTDAVETMMKCYNVSYTIRHLANHGNELVVVGVVHP
ncbi:hypothetical protein SAMD00019534_045060 [Acytostelium subglobosum LB1]|uniref:hypothetical protein n=1 Tax=Acytostelium subglobosum LB1 TaxID=1410327 RepID=UPI0006451F51|nr:hypothetical protein SAMD00019534_045060 [Acytostelium subglobosum LB1]GAM21331.1 hypothetical protein SAMD00019534_045060 [Acytostelium subglobosum LB1]|eukprot:XP_012755450.1 hypothetical protein SAMD00019534_045060 [Acytostelium subglobosum LB1]